MKTYKICFFAFVFAVLLAAFSLFASAESRLIGDVNNNSKIDAADYAMVKRHYLRTYRLTQVQQQVADANRNSKIDTADYAMIKRHFLRTYVLQGAVEVEPPAFSEGLAFSYDYSREGYTVTGRGSCTDTVIVIPEEYDGKPVTGIGRRAFKDASNIKQVYMPDSVAFIGDDAFSMCIRLDYVKLPESLESIGEYAFSHCALSRVRIPAGVKQISARAFNYCEYLSVVENRSSLPCGIGGEDCGGLAEYAYKLICKDGSIKYRSDGEYYETPDGFLFSNTDDGWHLKVYTGSKESIRLPESVKGGEYIVDFQQFGTQTAKEIFIPAGAELSKSAFYFCRNIEEIVFEENCESIAEGAFLYCDALKSVTIREGMLGIGEEAFENCAALQSISIPDSMRSIGYNAFKDCLSLEKIKLGDGLVFIAQKAFADTAYYKDKSHWDNGVLYIDGYLIKAEDTVSGEYVIKEGTKCIAAYAFEHCNSITGVVFPDSIRDLEINDLYQAVFAFVDCTSIRKVTVGKIIEKYSLSMLFGQEFDRTQIKEVTVLEGVERLCANALSGTGIEEFNFPASLTKIGTGAFSGTQFKSIVIPPTIKALEKSAFGFCSELESVTIGETVPEQIGEDVFFGCDNYKTIYVGKAVETKPMYQLVGESTKLAVIEEGVESICAKAFMSCDLNEVGLPSSLKSIGNEAFFQCEFLKIDNIPDSVTSIGSCAFGFCKSIESITLSNNLHIISESAFRNCSNLKSVYMPESVIRIEAGAFQFCTALEKADVPSHVEYIGTGAFGYCENLTSVIIPDSVTYLGNNAFYRCKRLESAVVGNGITVINETTFEECESLWGIVLPAGLKCVKFHAFWLTPPIYVFYAGTEEQWRDIEFSKDSGGDNTGLNIADITYNYKP